MFDWAALAARTGIRLLLQSHNHPVINQPVTRRRWQWGQRIACFIGRRLRQRGGGAVRACSWAAGEANPAEERSSRAPVAHRHVPERARHGTALRPTHPPARRVGSRGLPRCCAVEGGSRDSAKANCVGSRMGRERGTRPPPKPGKRALWTQVQLPGTELHVCTKLALVCDLVACPTGCSRLVTTPPLVMIQVATLAPKAQSWFSGRSAKRSRAGCGISASAPRCTFLAAPPWQGMLSGGRAPAQTTQRGRKGSAVNVGVRDSHYELT